MNGYMEQILNKIRKLKKKHIIMAVAVFILLIILIVFIGHIQEKVYKEKVKNNEYESANDFKTAKEYIIYSGNEYIREEKSKEENIEIDIYVKFTVNLYEEEKSNEEFFYRPCKYSSKYIILFKLQTNRQGKELDYYCYI